MYCSNYIELDFIEDLKFRILVVLHTYIYIYTLLVCQNGWTDRAKFCVGPHMTPWKIYVWSMIIIRKKLYLKVFDLVKYWKCEKKIIKFANRQSHN